MTMNEYATPNSGHGLRSCLRRALGMLAVVLLPLAAHAAQADMQCKPRGRLVTPLGELSQIHCADHGKDGVDRWSLGNRVLVEGKAPLVAEAADARQGLLVLSAAADDKTGCAANLFLLDLTGQAPRVFRFGVRNACNTYHRVSWGKQRSVIAIKNNVRFTYSAGRLIPPAHDAELVGRLEFSAYGGNPAFEQIVPFVDDIGPPAAGKGQGK